MKNGVGLERFGFGRFGGWLWRLERGTGAHSEVNEAGKRRRQRLYNTMGASVDGGDLHSVVTTCSIFATFFCVFSALSVAILVAVNWRPWRIYRCCA